MVKKVPFLCPVVCDGAVKQKHRTSPGAEPKAGLAPRCSPALCSQLQVLPIPCQTLPSRATTSTSLGSWSSGAKPAAGSNSFTACQEITAETCKKEQLLVLVSPGTALLQTLILPKPDPAPSPRTDTDESSKALKRNKKAHNSEVAEHLKCVYGPI